MSSLSESLAAGDSRYGCLTLGITIGLDNIHIDSNTIGIADGLKIVEEDGATPAACCLYSQSCVRARWHSEVFRFPPFFFAIDRSVLISWIPVESVINNGIILQGLAVEKFIETSEGQHV